MIERARVLVRTAPRKTVRNATVKRLFINVDVRSELDTNGFHKG